MAVLHIIHGHVCGCYYITPPINTWSPPVRHYLPPVDVKAHTSILSSTSRTTLTQTFVNSSNEKGIKKLCYAFPLYDGVSVVGFTCKIGNRLITGEVQEKEEARATFKEAADRGEVAGLLEQLPDASDVFTTTIGNIPPNGTVTVEITYLGELKHDAEVDGIRFTIPAAISPRYGSYPGELCSSGVQPTPGKFEITVDAMLEDGFFIKEMRSPTHPIAVSVGTVSTAAEDTPSMNKASASLSLTSVELDKDFVIQVVSKEFGTPTAVLETHPTIAGHRALMATLVPKFQLPPHRPEIVFVCDRSGSMEGHRISALINALTVFLKSLPVGVVFNICSFGSRHDFLWKKSAPYNQENLEKAMKHVQKFSANYGGTEMLNPVKDTIERRYSDRSLEVFLVTDGEIWDQQSLFDMLNEKIGQKKQPVRVFTLGVGDGVSHSLIEGVARAGNGFSQAVGENEKMDSKVVRMLKGALFPRVTDYSLEVQYEGGSKDADDFEMVEKVADSMKVKVDISDPEPEKSTFKKAISLFDPKANMDDDTKAPSKDDKDPFRHLPKVPVPKLLQAPNKIPPLFPFNRTTVYLLMSPDSCQGTPKSVILRGTSPEGPLELEIPIRPFEQPGQTIHQLAAKKAIGELEEGRGWVSEAKTGNGRRVKDRYPSNVDEMVRREAVRLGVQFQVSGKWCSFVATEKKIAGAEENDSAEEFDFLDSEMEAVTLSEDGAERGGLLDGLVRQSGSLGSNAPVFAKSIKKASRSSLMGSIGSSVGGMFTRGGAQTGASMPRMAGMAKPSGGDDMSFGGGGGSVDGKGLSGFAVGAALSPRYGAAPLSRTRFPSDSSATFEASAAPSAAFGAPPPPPAPMMQAVTRDDAPKEELKSAVSYKRKRSLRQRFFTSTVGGHEETCADTSMTDEDDEECSEQSAPEIGTTGSLLQALIALQTFEGSWEWKSELLAILSLNGKEVEKSVPKTDMTVFATALAVRFLETKLVGEKDSWELVVEKARRWIEERVGVQGLKDAFALAEKALA